MIVAVLLGAVLASLAVAPGVDGSPDHAAVASRASHRVSPPSISDNRIAFGHKRKRETAAYSKRHYGERRWHLKHPKVIVLHYTNGPTWRSARNAFASNAPSLGELPGVCSHYVVAQDGGIHEIVRPRIRCRHTIGLNYTAIGVEMVQEQDGSSHHTDEDILHRHRQISHAVHLVAFLQQRYGIKLKNVIGHAMANDSPYFKDLEGWSNDHTDWERQDVRKFRKRLRARTSP
jgi:N-acetylmuramoyl-L-alanine amidase